MRTEKEVISEFVNYVIRTYFNSEDFLASLIRHTLQIAEQSYFKMLDKSFPVPVVGPRDGKPEMGSALHE